ncbi:MAG TPA: alpha/beta fold hydrolase [Thermoanaerobaculia bacterium]|nr:alpha/beta fold hydrolase [Thermoanaerobaculia bacterium]
MIRGLVFALSLLAALPALAQTPQGGAAAEKSPSYRTEDVRYRNGSVTLAALLMLPRSGSPVAGAVIAQGSGTSDRTNGWARAIAEELVGSGLAVLLTDKRGSGASEGDWQRADFGDLAGDALAGVRYLRGRPEVDRERVGLVGLSQGGWVVPLAAARSDEVAFVIDISGASVSFAEQSFTEMANTARQAGLPEDQVREVLELNRAAGEYLVTGDWERYRRAREHGLGRPWKEIAAGFPGAPDLPVWTFLRGVAAYDPLPYWIQLTEPVLVLYGAEDEHDNVPVAESVRRLEHAFRSAAKTNYEIVVIPGAGHGFLDPKSRELMPAFVERLRGWVGRTVGVGARAGAG